jgi:radical SAM superfamily enzyme YgiQ (UPF0313 family)
MKKRKIFFADLNHINPGKEWTIIPFPLNIAYLAAFLQKMLPGTFEVRLFKDPRKFLDAISNEKPDITAFSNYIWNKNLQLEFAKLVKKLHPTCIVAMGGPNYNFNESAWINEFAGNNPQIDFHINGEGEVKLYNLAACCVAHDFDLASVKEANPAGVAFFRSGNERLTINELSTVDAWHRLEGLNLDLVGGRLRDLNDVPSPYLTGLLDEFLADPNFCPIIETNRGCPYSCTFCNWGDMGKSKSAMFSLERVIAELRFIAEKNIWKTPYLYLGDANFGLFQRDVEIANLLRELKDSVGFPQSVYLYFAKNSSEKVVRIAEILKDMTAISLSRQTQNKDVLKIIKRSNINIDTFNRLADLAKSLGIESEVELIYALPGESKKSFYEGVEEVMRQKVDGVHMFPAMLLDGSEMGTKKSCDRFGIKGEWRRIDGCAGVYGPVAAIEFEKIIVESKVMSREDYFEIRVFHFLQNIFLGTKLYKDVEALLGNSSLFDLIQEVIANFSVAPPPFRDLIEAFVAQAKEELLAEPPTKFSVTDVERSLASSLKLNPMYSAKLLYDEGVRDAFHLFLKQLILKVGATTETQVDQVLGVIDSSIYPFDGTVSKRVEMDFDVVEFSRRPRGQKADISAYELDAKRTYAYTRKFTYQNFIEVMPRHMSLAEKVYEVLLHHTHEKFRKTVTWQLDGEMTFEAVGSGLGAENADPESDKRKIQLEGGWVY